MESLVPGSTIGIVGGGQLGRMLAQRARTYGYRVVVLTGGEQQTPAGVIADREIDGRFDDPATVADFLDAVDVVTWEFESVNVAVGQAAVAAGIPVRPSPEVVAIAQDRGREKEALSAVGVPVAPWREADSLAGLEQAIDELGTPVIVKTARFGYDGKGQVRVDEGGQARQAWAAVDEARVVVESVVPFQQELSVVIARGVDGAMVDHGVMENVHVNHILDTTVVPAGVGPDLIAEAGRLARLVAEGLDVVGVICVELFATESGLVVNEIAPRPHNSGHCTIEAAQSSQFDQQLRAVCGLPLGNGACQPAAMAQLLGDLWAGDPLDWPAALANPAVSLHLYGKAEARPGRKMGHLTCVATDPGDALQQVLDARNALTGR